MQESLAFFRGAFEALPVGMLIVDERGLIVFVNRQLEQLFGHPREALINQPLELLVDGDAAQHRAHRDRFMTNAEARPMGAGRHLFGRHRDGHKVPVEIGLNPLRTGDGHFVLAAVVDLTERKRSEEQLQASVHEKETLLRELHHRAKNNLQLIASLLDLAQDAPASDVLSECRERINSIALVHEKLYQSGTLARIDFEDYLSTLGQQVAQAWARAEGPLVGLSIEAQQVSLPLDQAIPCGLVVNELVTNAFKHAFPDGREGRVRVQVLLEGTKVTLRVVDDGVGLPPGPPQRTHIGLELVRALARQLRGKVDFQSAAPGTAVTLSFEGAP